ncbi:hypothetical protein pb186bvf_019606 [Paramecium bursaria]
MSNYLNQTRAKRKENYDFLNQIMQDNKINFENLISPKNESITSSQMTDQIIKIVNRNASPISNREPQNSISNRYTENYQNEQEEQDIPIINEIDNIIDRIKHKYSNFDHKQLTDQKQKSPIKQQDQNEDDVLKSIKQKIKNEQQPQTHGGKLPTKEQHIQQLNQVPIKQSEKKTQSIIEVQQQRSSPTKANQNKSNEGSSMKKEIKRLKETFKVSKPPLSQKSEDQDRQQIQDATFFPVQTESNEAQSNYQPPTQTDQITTQFQQDNLQTENYTTTPLKTEEEIHYQYSTPHKRDEIYSQLSYSQSQISQSNNKSSYFNNPQTNSKQTIHDFDDDPIIQALVKEEVQLLQRLQYLQDQLKNQFI